MDEQCFDDEINFEFLRFTPVVCDERAERCVINPLVSIEYIQETINKYPTLFCEGEYSGKLAITSGVNIFGNSKTKTILRFILDAKLLPQGSRIRIKNVTFGKEAKIINDIYNCAELIDIEYEEIKEKLY